MRSTAISHQRSGISRRLTASHGFSLVEVTLAMAVMAIGLIAILGLIPQGVTSSRDAADNTTAATMVQDLFSTIRASPFITVDLSGFGTLPAGSTYNLQILNPPVTTYFDQAGFNPTTTADYYFRVVLSFRPHPTLPSLSVITATVSWPAKLNMATTPLNTTKFMTQVAQYN